MIENNFNARSLAIVFKRTRLTRGLSLRDAGAQMGISPSTLSRVENAQGIPDIETYRRLTEWLGVPLARFLGSGEAPVVVLPTETMPAVIEAHLRADQRLTAEQVALLADTLRALYEHFTQEKTAAKAA